MWCEGGHLHRECPEKGKANSVPAYCNWKLMEGEKPYPANYKSCSQVKNEMRRRKMQKAPKPNTRRAFSFNHIAPGRFFAEALQHRADHCSSKPIHDWLHVKILLSKRGPRPIRSSSKEASLYGLQL
jgi:hypothetical protein